MYFNKNNKLGSFRLLTKSGNNLNLKFWNYAEDILIPQCIDFPDQIIKS